MPESDHYSIKEFTKKIDKLPQTDAEKLKKAKGVYYEKKKGGKVSFYANGQRKDEPLEDYYKFRAGIHHKGVDYFLGRFDTLDAAIEERKRAELALKQWKKGGEKPYFMKEKDYRKIPYAKRIPKEKKKREKQGYLGRPIPVDTLYLKDEDLEEWQMEYMKEGMLREGYLTAKQRKLMRERRKHNLCTYCKRGKVEWIEANEPWSPAHWYCPKCDSTFPENEYPKGEDGLWNGDT